MIPKPEAGSNRPFGVFLRAVVEETPRGGIAIGDGVLDLLLLSQSGLLQGDALAACRVAAGPALILTELKSIVESESLDA